MFSSQHTHGSITSTPFHTRQLQRIKCFSSTHTAALLSLLSTQGSCSTSNVFPLHTQQRYFHSFPHKAAAARQMFFLNTHSSVTFAPFHTRQLQRVKCFSSTHMAALLSLLSTQGSCSASKVSPQQTWQHYFHSFPHKAAAARQIIFLNTHSSVTSTPFHTRQLQRVKCFFSTHTAALLSLLSKQGSCSASKVFPQQTWQRYFHSFPHKAAAVRQMFFLNTHMAALLPLLSTQGSCSASKVFPQHTQQHYFHSFPHKAAAARKYFLLNTHMAALLPLLSTQGSCSALNVFPQHTWQCYFRSFPHKAGAAAACRHTHSMYVQIQYSNT